MCACWDSKNPASILLDVLIFVTALTVLVCVEWAALQPLKTLGFYCNDPKLNFKYEGDTVSTDVLVLVSFVLPCFIFMIVEWSSGLSSRKTHKDTTVNSVWMRTRYWYFIYLYGLCFTFMLTDLAKLLVGEPRPHFFNTCQPEQLRFNCSENQYIEDYTCTMKDSASLMADSFKSFPSGHASFSTYFAIFIANYFAEAIRTESQFLIYFLQILGIFWAMFCSFSRVTDHRHHWWDVLAGSILGVVVALYFFHSDRLRRKNVTSMETSSQHFPSHLINSNE